MFGILALACITVLGHRADADLAAVSFLYMLVVVLQSLAGDALSSLLISIGAVACLDFFFVDPLYTFTVAKTVDLVALLSFVTTALVVTGLVLRARREAESARRERKRMEALYQLSQRLLETKPHTVLPMRFLDPFLGVFGCTAVCIFDSETAEFQTLGTPRGELCARTQDAYVSGCDTNDPVSGICARRLLVAGRAIGAVGFENLDEPRLTSGPLATLAAALLERTRALRDASDAAAATQAEVYRSAILDALAHEFKTPLATILAAAGGLPEAGHLTPEQGEMAEIVETEAARLGSLTSRLLRIARLDREEVKPRLEWVDVAATIAPLIDRQARRFRDRRICFVPPAAPLESHADPELLRLAIGQLLENACKYSQPGSVVAVSIVAQPERAAIRVSNTGSAVSPADRQRIFERFYRGTDANRLAAGSGLGLYVARKIAAAHGGALELEAPSKSQDEVTFRFTLPARIIEAPNADTDRNQDAAVERSNCG